jgi:hypothetical protein
MLTGLGLAALALVAALPIAWNWRDTLEELTVSIGDERASAIAPTTAADLPGSSEPT